MLQITGGVSYTGTMTVISQRGKAFRLAWGLASTIVGIMFFTGIVRFGYMFNQLPLTPSIQPFFPVLVAFLYMTSIATAGGGVLAFALERRSMDGIIVVKPVQRLLLGLVTFDAILGFVIMGAMIILVVEFHQLASGEFLDLVFTLLVVFEGIGAVLSTGGMHVLHAWRTRRQVPPVTPSLAAISVVLIVAMAGTGAIFAFTPPAACKDFPSDLPFHATLFQQGTEGYHTFKIPALQVASNGTVLAFCEGRVDNEGDFDDIDLVMRKSHDNGTTWSPLIVLVDEGAETVGNPCPVLDEHTGTIFLPYCLNNDRAFIINSTDHGETWSQPREITSQVKVPGWNWYAFGPTHGIQLSTGRLVIPSDHTTPDSWHSHVIYSDDHGASWAIGGSVKGGSESTVVEAANGSLYLNMRAHQHNRRISAWSNDGGITWTEAMVEPALVEPPCQGSLLRLTNTTSFATSRVLFSNPASTFRERVSVRVSYDECATWSEGTVIFPGPSSYSDLAATKDRTQVFCLLETGCNFYAERIVFTRFTLEWMTGGADALDPR